MCIHGFDLGLGLQKLLKTFGLDHFVPLIMMYTILFMTYKYRMSHTVNEVSAILSFIRKFFFFQQTTQERKWFFLALKSTLLQSHDGTEKGSILDMIASGP